MAEASKKSLVIERIYNKNVSVETPGAPAIFSETIQPEINIDLRTKHTPVRKDTIEVSIAVTATAKKEASTIFLVEVEKAGIFHVEGFDEKEMEHLIAVYLPTLLFPFVREVIAEQTSGAGFPPLYLAPINFDAVYAQKQEKMKQQTAVKESQEPADVELQVPTGETSTTGKA